MPTYTIERARLLRIAEIIYVEAPTLEEAKAIAMEHVPTGGAEVLEDSIDYSTEPPTKEPMTGHLLNDVIHDKDIFDPADHEAQQAPDYRGLTACQAGEWLQGAWKQSLPAIKATWGVLRWTFP